MTSIIAQPAAVHDQGDSPSRRIRGQHGRYSCAYCEKVFKRSEHRIRHERTHTNEKPFSCRYCRRSYSRKDLVTRHERTLHAHGQAEPSALPVAASPVSSEGSLGEVVDGSIAHRSGDEPTATGIAAAAPANETSTLERGASPAAIDSPSNPPVRGVNGIGNSSVIDDTRPQPPPHHPPSIVQSIVSTDPTPSLANQPEGPSTHSASERPDVYMALQDGFDMYHTSPQIPMDVDHDQEQGRHEEFRDVPEHHHPQLHAYGSHPFPPCDAPSQASTMNQDMVPGFMDAFEPADMPYFAFSPFPSGLFEPSQTMPSMPSAPILDMLDYPSLHNPTASRLDASVSSTSAPRAHSPSQLPSSHDRVWSSGTDTLVPREPPSNLPQVVKDKPSKIPNVVADNTLHASICKDLANRLDRPQVPQEVPSSTVLKGFLNSFFECYYKHQPFIHLPTLSMADTPSPLILAMCCIGALYRLDRRRAQTLYTICTQSIAADVRRFIKSSEECPLWVVQTKLLLSAYGALNSDKELSASVMDENGFYTLIYDKMRLALAAENHDMNKMTWDSFVRRESWKRLLGGIYVASTIHVIIWDANPAFNTSRDLELEVLYDESLWNAKTATEWSELRANQPEHEYRTLKAGLASIMSENKADSPRISACRLSPFTALLLMHAVVIHVWQLVQVAQTLSPASPLGRDPVSSMLMNAALRSLARSHELLVNAQSENAADPGLDETTSQIFTCQAILRMAYIRLVSVANGFNRPSLIALDQATAIKSFVSTFAITKLERSPHLLDAVAKAFEGLRIPVRMGHMLVRKTAALRWSPAHAIAGWDCALFVCKWVHSVEIDCLNDTEPTPAESELLDSIREVLEEAEYDIGESRSLAAGVARTWSWMLQDVWVWSITPRMGAVLEQIAAAFERVNDANRRPGA